MNNHNSSLQFLVGIIDSINDGAAVYDQEDRLIQFNDNYRQNFLLSGDILEPGLGFAEMLKSLARRGLFDGPGPEMEDWIAQCIKRFAEGAKGNEFQRVDGRRLRVDYTKLQGGGTFVVTSDVTTRGVGESANQQSHQNLEQVIAERTADLRAANESLRATNAQLTDAIESINEGFIYYDADARLVYCNKKYREFYPWIEDILVPGVHLEDVARTAADRGQDAEEIADVDRWVQDRLEAFETGRAPHEQHLRDGRWLLCNESRTSDGGFVGIRTDLTESKRAEEERRLSVQRLEDIAEAASDWFWELDADLRFTYLSNRYEDVAGVSSELLLGKRPEEVYPRSAKRQSEIWRNYFEAVRKQQDFREFVHDDFRQDGRRRVIRNTGKAIFDEAGVFVGYRGTSTDITDLRLVEEALRERETMLNAVIENVPMSLCLKDLEGRFALVNPTFEQLHGVVADEVLGKTFFDILPHEVAVSAAAEDRQVIETGAPMRTEYAWPSRLGTLRELIFKFPLRADEEGPVTGIGVIALDVTEQKRSEDDLRKSEERLQQAVQLAQLGHYIWDCSEDCCVYCSEEYAATYGVSATEYVARTTTRDGGVFIHPDDRDAYAEAIEALRQGAGFEMEYRVVTPGGEERHVREVAKPLFDENGVVVQGIFTIQDTTAVKTTEARLAHAQKMEAVGQLTGGIAHDFNNLLAVIRGNAELLAESAGTIDPMMQAIIRSTERGGELTQRLLAFSRQQPLRPQSINLAVLTRGMSELLKRTLGETIEIEFVEAPDTWSAMADPGQVENALLNLVLNARDAMPGGGKLTVECGNAQLDDAYVAENSDAKSGAYAVMAVSDEGKGMTAEVRAHAFEPFFTTNEVGQGSGLGLSMVYGFAKQSGGHATIYSEMGRGTTVKIYLPRSETAAQSEAESANEAVPRGRGEMVLVIEDDPDVRSLAVRMLKGLAYRVIDVPDAAEAHAALSAESPVDLVLSDVILPGDTSGPEFAEQARSTRPGLKIIFMSGYPTEAARRNGFLGSDQVLLNKPFHRAQLAQALRRALD